MIIALFVAFVLFCFLMCRWTWKTIHSNPFEEERIREAKEQVKKKCLSENDYNKELKLRLKKSL